MAVPVEEAIAALSTFSLEDDQPEVQGLAATLSTERCATNSPIEYGDVAAYRLSLSEDTKAVNQLNTLIQEGREMASVLYTYRSCVKALPQLPDSMKQSQAELYLETYQVLDLEMSRLREIQRWQSSAAAKLAADMQRFSRPERRINGPTITHLWSMLKLLDVLVQLDHLKNAKASIPNDFSWYKRTFTQVSVQWQDTDSMREELDDLQIFLSTRWAILLNLHVEMFRVNNVEDILHVLIIFCVESVELDFALLFPDRHVLLRVLPVLVVLATSSEKDGESLYKRVKINRLINIFKNDPVIPAFPDLHLSPAAILKELAMYFQKFSTQTRLLTLPAPHELPPRETQEYPRQYLIVNHIGAIRAEHDDFVIRFASSMNQIVLLKSTDGADIEWCKEVKGNMYDMVVEGFQLLSRWTGRIWEQCAWKFSRPCKDAVPVESNETSASYSDYEKVVRWNYTSEERKALVELVSYIKSIGSMMQRCDTLVADALCETVHAEVQDFVQNKLATMLRTTFRKKKDLSRILSDMRTLSADWMANANKPETEMQSLQHGDESKGNFFYPRPVAPTAAQVHCLQFLIYELVSGGNLRKPGGLFGNSGSENSINDLKQLETFFYKLSFFLHILDYTVTIGTLTDLGFLWFREFYLESSRVIQFPIQCSLPWMLVDHVIESQNAGLLESILMPLDIYNDSAQHALAVLKQRFLYDEIEAEVDVCFDQLVLKLSETIFTYYKSWAASELLDPSFLFALDNGEKYSVQPMRFNALLKMTRVKVLGRTIDFRSLIAERMNKMFRENLEFLFDRFESQDLCAIVVSDYRVISFHSCQQCVLNNFDEICLQELEKLLDILKHSHELLSKDLSIDSFNLMLNEMQENISLVSFSSRLASQIWSEMQNDFLPNFIFCNTTQRFIRSSKVSLVPIQKPSVPSAKPNFYCGTQDLNMAHQSFARLHSGFLGIQHIFSIARLLGSRSLPWLIRALLDYISNRIAALEPMITGLQEALPKSIGLLPFDGGVAGCQRIVKEHLNWGSKSELKSEVLRGIKEIGSVLCLMALVDIVLREVDTTNFMQTSPWLGLIPGADGQILHSQEVGDSPLVSLFKSAAAAIESYPKCSNPLPFYTISKQAEAADLLYKANINSGSVLEYTLAFTSATLDKYCTKWNAAPKTGFIDITTSKDFYRVFSGLQFGYMEDSILAPSNNHEVMGDSVAWGGCTIIYLLGQQMHFELFDFSYQLLNIAEVETATITQKLRNANYVQGWENLLEAMKKERRLNNHVFSMLKARCPLEDKTACAIKQSGAPLHRIKFENTVSAFETLPQKGA
ncbi:Cytoplasmic FMR1-interacting [Macleaya cordata]|uniref:Cytoplasmic FMR1-interacting n=1 Tax=Macleaya cordata TaxID=56857 RepID=A0A200PVJ1_MACCD|nr:Cytoplasmic FMR1-interacting [Macleaya cordata]